MPARPGTDSLFPTGTVTFLFTDIEGSTTLWDQYPAAMQAALARHDRLLRHAIESSGGCIVKTTGDGVYRGLRRCFRCARSMPRAQRALQAPEAGVSGPELTAIRCPTADHAEEYGWACTPA